MTWRQWFANPYRAVATVVVLIVAGPFLVVKAGEILAMALQSLTGMVLLAAIVIYSFRRMTGLAGGRRR